MLKRLVPVLFLIVGAAVLCAQNADDVIAVKISTPDANLILGQKNPLSIAIEVKEPYHINSEQPTEDYLVPTAIRFEKKNGFVFGEIQLPEPQIKKLAFSATPLSVYEGTFAAETSVTLPSSFAGEEVTIAGTVHYQACDDNSCLAPTDLRFSQTFKIKAASKELPTAAPEGTVQIQTEGQAKTSTSPKEGEFAQTVKNKGLFLTFLLIFLGGLALNLTPCVYPIIPITVGYFGGQAGGRKGGILLHAVMYVLGMAVTYSALGVIASLTGSLFGSALQNPFVLIGIALVLVALALSMFDLYEFRIPSFMSRLAGGSKKGYMGSLFMGLTVGLVAAPCIGPFVLGLLTYVGERGSVLLGFLMFFVLALGLGLPFLFLGVFSGSINKLPRSGSWMVWVRTIFGFVLIAMAVYFLRPLFPSSLIYALTLAVTLFVGGIYMAWIEPTKMGGRVFLLIRNFTGIVFFAAALVFASSGIQSYVKEQIHEAGAAGEAIVHAGEVQWATYSESRIQEAQVQHKPVLIDFYADWCIPCKELDKLTFSDSNIINISKKFVMLKVDLTTTNNPVYERLRSKYKIKGVPTLVILKPDGGEVRSARVVGFIKAENLAQSMKGILEEDEGGLS